MKEKKLETLSKDNSFKDYSFCKEKQRIEIGRKWRILIQGNFFKDLFIYLIKFFRGKTMKSMNTFKHPPRKSKI